MTKTKTTNLKFCLWSIIVVLLLVPTLAWGHCTCDVQARQHESRSKSLKYKLIAIASILVAGTIGVGLPQFGRKLEASRPGSDIFFMVKAFAAGVILATGYIHILPDAFNSLTSPCLKGTPWGDFPFTGLVAMMSSIGTLMVDSFATGYYKRLHFDNNSNKTQQEVINGHEDIRVIVGGEEHQGHVHIHTHATHGHAHGSSTNIPSSGHHEIVTLDLIRHRIISQVLELGIVFHSVIIGISLGACQNPQVIKPLLAALSFHQFFEGMGLGGCISQAKFKSLSTAIMVLFFSLTAPAGIAIGIAVSSVYKEDSPTALIVQGIFYSAAAGILIYMALVDLLAADFMNPRMQANGRLQLGAYISLLLGASCMSVLAKWA